MIELGEAAAITDGEAERPSYRSKEHQRVHYVDT
jgi:hypothetical protein